MAEAVLQGAKAEQETSSTLLHVASAGLEQLLNTDGLIIGSPENFGYMSGMVKDFFDRTYYPAQEYALNLPYGLFIKAGNDGSGAVREMDRILTGYPMKQVLEPVVVVGELTETHLEACKELGETMASGLAFGIY